MTPRQLQKLKRALMEMRLSPRGRKPADMEALAVALGRRRHERGKEPTYVRVAIPALPPPLSIPAHARDLKVATARSIIDVLLNDVAIWEDYLPEVADDN